MNYFSAGRFLPVGLFTTLDLSPSVTIFALVRNFMVQSKNMTCLTVRFHFNSSSCS
ncbi:Uncharacterised protein [Escherichia coli]|uniref:Uncharacterized protein n=1 Tax=Escherichia coli TaxID=562 RepID=A0A377DTQ2_ECOLX|nr:Uncharacterised protein [Escherichia coli]